MSGWAGRYANRFDPAGQVHAPVQRSEAARQGRAWARGAGGFARWASASAKWTGARARWLGAWAGWTGAWAGWAAAAGPALAFVGLAEVTVRSVVTGMGVEPALAVALLALGSTLPVSYLGRTAAAVVTCSSEILSLAGFHLSSVGGCLGVVIALYRLGLGARRPVLAQVPVLAVTVGFFVLALIGPGPFSSEAAVITSLSATLCPVALCAGMTVHARTEAREYRAAQQVIASTLVEHTARSERARIARELHDVVAHHISMVAVQAETARLTLPGLSATGAQKLSAIGDTARTALVEMRRLLAVLRDDGPAMAAERYPQPGLAQVTDLIDEAREASGSAARLILSGSPVPLDPNVELAAYRIVQEALTNARRHAPGAAVDVELAYKGNDLRLRVRDNGPGPASPAPPGGHGVVGMRERAIAAGGSLRSGPAAGGGYQVEAVFPTAVGQAVGPQHPVHVPTIESPA